MVLGVIGAGNIAKAMIAGITKSGSLNGEEIIVSNHNLAKAQELSNQYGVKIDENISVIKNSQVVLLAVKPYAINKVLNEYNNLLADKIIVSVAAGIPVCDMEHVNSNFKIIRMMPNTPVEVCKGVIAYTKGTHINDDDMKLVERVFSRLGLFTAVDEDKMNAVSSLTGCSPAYIYQIIEAMSDAGVKMGLSRELALKLSSKAVEGAGSMVFETNIHPAVLKDNVTSPAGSTIEGVAELENRGLRGIIISVLYKAFEKTLLFAKKK